MTGSHLELAELLRGARERGRALTGAEAIKQSYEAFTTYAGLISRSMELAKLKATEKRDLAAIGAHYEIESSRIALAFKQLEAELRASFSQNEMLMASSFQCIEMLIAAGEHEIASEFHRRMLENLHRPSLDQVVDARNAAAEGSGTRLRTY